MTIKFKDLVEKSGAGDWGTKELTDTLRKDTPGQGITDIGAKNKSKLEERAPKIDPNRLNRILKIPKFKITYGGTFHTVQAKDTDEALKKAWKLFKLAAHVKLAFMKSAKIDRIHEESLDLEEAFTTKEIRQAVGIAAKMGGNMTGATKAIEKLKKGLSKHPQVNAVLRRVNEDLQEKVDPADYVVGSEKSKFGGHRAEVKNKKTGKVMYLGSVGWKSPKHAKKHAQAYLDGYARGGDRSAQNKSADFINKNDSKVVKKESVDEAMTLKDIKNKKEREDKRKKDGETRQQRLKRKVYGEALKEGAISVSTVEKEIRSNGGSKIKKTDQSLEFMYRGSAHTIPLDRGFVRDTDYMKLQKYFG